MKPKSTSDCITKYGAITADPSGALLWRDAPAWIRPLQVPDKIKLKNILGKPVYRIFCNTDIHVPLLEAFHSTILVGCADEFSTFDGCFNVRWVRGVPGVPSYHSWAIALDFNAADNPLGGKGVWSDDFIECFEDAGFFWGGRYKSRPDPMHFEWIDRTIKSPAQV